MSLQTKTEVPPFSAEHIEAICHVLADTQDGLGGRTVAEILSQMNIADPTPTLKSWKRLFNALVAFQNQYELGNAIIVFITRAMDPARYATDALLFEDRRVALNKILGFSGFMVRGDGKIVRCDPTREVDESVIRANEFQSQLLTRGLHDKLFNFCTPAILARGYYFAVFESLRAVSAQVRALSGLEGEGANLMERAFSLGKTGQPLVAINSLETEPQKAEQRAFLSLLIGLFGTARNPLAHNVKLDWQMSELDALDTMSVISLVQRKLDGAAEIQRFAKN